MSGESVPSERPRLQLKPRDPNAVQAYEAQRVRAGSNPFGAAKPREQVIAERLGKTEEEVLKETVKKERPKLRLNSEQLEQRKQAEARIEEVKIQLQLETANGGDQSALEAELASREADLEVLLDTFEALALEAAQRGEIQRPSERRQQQQQGHGDIEAGRLGGRAGYSERGGYDRHGHGRGHYDKESGASRGGYGGETREYDRFRGGFDRDVTNYSRGAYGQRGGRGGAVYERAPRDGGYDRYERSYDRDGGRSGGDREGGRSGGGYERNEGDYNNGPRGGRGGDWGGERGGYSRGGGGYDRRGGGSSYDRRDDEGLQVGHSGGMDDGIRGGRSSRSGYGNRGRGYDPAYEELNSMDYVSPYQNTQDRF
ncbi:hypothetical protein VaNZ11_005684 [Volvox africanus]|uniref:Uncharacterized protein n=1 Tax=Volvox africanus TaxID=51714 RepID=A0ABQ5RZQ5_9CHLO|nr:hypothetical protein VaNZ11_005684 [Volvox africanus]